MSATDTAWKRHADLTLVETVILAVGELMSALRVEVGGGGTLGLGSGTREAPLLSHHPLPNSGQLGHQ